MTHLFYWNIKADYYFKNLNIDIYKSKMIRLNLIYWNPYIIYYYKAFVVLENLKFIMIVIFNLFLNIFRKCLQIIQ